jgi:DnaK suppressor protein
MAGTTTSTPKKPATGKQASAAADVETKPTGKRGQPAAAPGAVKSDRKVAADGASAKAPRHKASEKAPAAPEPAAREKSPVQDKAPEAKPAKATNGKPAADKHEKAAGSKPGALGKAAHPAPARKSGEGYAADHKFLESQRRALEIERSTYMEQAKSLRAEADSLVEEMEPGDIQFDEESGEGGTVTVDRERDLALSAQALAAVEEIDHALAKIDLGTYGICENCGSVIPKNRLEALPYARLCISCKSGGLSRR